MDDAQKMDESEATPTYNDDLEENELWLMHSNTLDSVITVKEGIGYGTKFEPKTKDGEEGA
jgi:hypothetical protein